MDEAEQNAGPSKAEEKAEAEEEAKEESPAVAKPEPKQVAPYTAFFWCK